MKLFLIVIFIFVLTDKARSVAEGVGVIKDKELKLEETEASHTLGGAGEDRVQVRGEGADATRLCESKEIEGKV